jgi:hypothetical protein
MMPPAGAASQVTIADSMVSFPGPNPRLQSVLRVASKPCELRANDLASNANAGTQDGI